MEPLSRERALELLRGGEEGVREWNDYRDGEEGPAREDLSLADLRGASMIGVDLQGADLTGANLRGADLSGAHLSLADLTGASLRDANLTRAFLFGATLVGADLRRAHLWRAEMLTANLRDADLRFANLTSAILEGADLAGARVGDTVFSVDLYDVGGLDQLDHHSDSPISYASLQSLEEVPEGFLRGLGFENAAIEFLEPLLGTPIRFYSTFISYSTEDRLFSQRLHDALQGRGIRCWLDEKKILPGDHIHDSINDAIRFHDKVLLCASKHALESWWVDREVERALKKEERLWKERGERVLSIVPLNLDGYLLDEAWTRGYADDLRGRNAADFTGWEQDAQKFEAQLERVVAALRSDPNARRAPPKPQL